MGRRESADQGRYRRLDGPRCGRPVQGRRADRGEQDLGRGSPDRGPSGRRGDRRLGDDRDTGLYRHPPPHLADGGAQHRRGLDPVPVLYRGAGDPRPTVPTAGCLRVQPARDARGPGLRHHDAARLVAHPEHPRAHRRRDRGSEGLGPSSVTESRSSTGSSRTASTTSPMSAG